MSQGFLVLFEDEWAPRFEPIVFTRSVAGLRLGAWTHRERWERLFPDRKVVLVCRGALAASEREVEPWNAVNDVPAGDALFVAAALGRAPSTVTTAIRELEAGSALVAEDRLVAARVVGDSAARLGAVLREAAGADFGSPRAPETARVLGDFGLRARGVEVSWPRTLVDLVRTNEDALREDIAWYARLVPSAVAASFPGAHLVHPERIHLGEGVRVDRGVVLDASDGPILLGPGSHVMANSVVTGPVAVGRDGRLKPLTRLSTTSLGPVCRVGGEVDGCIVLGWSNKQHDGFLGHSYLGAWVNLGAATDTSDLKNDYGSVRVTLRGETIDTGDVHVGSLIGDHTKTAIHTRLNTGTVVGVSCNVLGPDFPPKAIPSFCWGGGGAWSEYRVEKAVGVARLVVQRRGVTLRPTEETLLRSVHAASAHERADFLPRS